MLFCFLKCVWTYRHDLCFVMWYTDLRSYWKYYDKYLSLWSNGQVRYPNIWATTWQTNKMACAPSEDSDQPGHPPSLIKVFAFRMKKSWVLSYPLSAQRRLWSDWADAQADLSLRWAHSHFVGFDMSRLIRAFTIMILTIVYPCLIYWHILQTYFKHHILTLFVVSCKIVALSQFYFRVSMRWLWSCALFEPPEDKTSLRPVWSKSLLCAQWVTNMAKDLRFLHADSEDWSNCAIWVFAGRTCQFVGFVMRRLIWLCSFLLQSFCMSYPPVQWLCINYIMNRIL